MNQDIAQLFEHLYFAPKKYKQRYLNRIIRAYPEELDWMIAVLLGSQWIPLLKVTVLKKRLLESIDTEEFERSKAFVGDTLECVSKLWPVTPRVDDSISIRTTIKQLKEGRSLDPLWLFLDHSSEIVRWFLLKVFFESPKWGIEKRNLWMGLADCSNRSAEYFESRWYGVEAPYEVVASFLKGDQQALGSIPEGVVFDRVLDFETQKLHEVKTQGVEEFQFLKAPNGKLVLVVVNQVRCGVFDEHGLEVSDSFPEISDQAYSKNGSWVGMVEELSSIEGVSYIESRLRRKRLTLAICESNPIRFHFLFSVEDHLLMPCELEPFECTSDHGGGDKVESFQDWEAVGSGLWAYCFFKQTGSKKWKRLKRDDQTAQLVLLYCEKSPRSQDLMSLTLGFEEGGVWFPCMKVEPLFHLFDETRFADWLKKNKTRKIGPIVEVNRTLIIRVQYESMIVSKRRKAGFYLHAGKILQIEWDSSILDISNRKTLKQL